MTLTNEQVVFVLGAGASVDYGLPTWRELNDLIKMKIGNDKNELYKYKKEILDWLNKIGDNKKYGTIDKCIELESVSHDYHSNGHEIENEIFSIIQDIFKEKYRDNDTGWIRILNEKIKNRGDLRLENQVAFINYNYDDVLDKNFLNFDYLAVKLKLLKDKTRLDILSKARVCCLHPHGYFQPENVSPYISKEKDTMKSGSDEFIDVVSCYESKHHDIPVHHSQKLLLIILGLGGGLEVNLNNIRFGNPISSIHITVKDKKLENQIIDYLSKKFKIDQTKIKIYQDCNDLIGNLF